MHFRRLTLSELRPSVAPLISVAGRLPNTPIPDVLRVDGVTRCIGVIEKARLSNLLHSHDAGLMTAVITNWHTSHPVAKNLVWATIQLCIEVLETDLQ